MTTFVDCRIVIYATSDVLVDGASKEQKTIIFDGLCAYWATASKDLQDTGLSRGTSLIAKDVSIDGVVNGVVIGDKVELFDINNVSIGLFVISELDKFNSPKGRASNTFMRVYNRDV